MHGVLKSTTSTPRINKKDKLLDGVVKYLNVKYDGLLSTEPSTSQIELYNLYKIYSTDS